VDWEKKFGTKRGESNKMSRVRYNLATGKTRKGTWNLVVRKEIKETGALSKEGLTSSSVFMKDLTVL